MKWQHNVFVSTRLSLQLIPRNFLNLAVKCVSCWLEPQGGPSSHSSHQESRQPRTEHISMLVRACCAHGARRAGNVNIDMYIIIQYHPDSILWNDSKEVRNAVNNSSFVPYCVLVWWLNDWAPYLWTIPQSSSLTPLLCPGHHSLLTRGWWPHTPPDHNQNKTLNRKTLVCWRQGST